MYVEVDLLVILIDDNDEYVNVHGVDDLDVLENNNDDDVVDVNLKDNYDGDGVVNVMK